MITLNLTHGCKLLEKYNKYMKQNPFYEVNEYGSYKSKNFLNPIEVYNDDYWSIKHNRSTIDEQVANVIEKNKYVKRDIYKDGNKRILEIACSPGILIGELSDSFECHGIEIDERYKQKIKTYSKLAELYFGFFPQFTQDWKENTFSNIIALDVFEHVEDGHGFLKECKRLLCNNGRLIIQAPIIMEDEIMPDIMFLPSEHIWIYNHKHFKKMLIDVKLSLIKTERIFPGHEHWVIENKI